MLANFVSSLNTPHALASLSDTVPVAGTISGKGTTPTLVRSTLGIAGSSGDISSTLLSVVGPLSLDVKGGVGVDWGELG